MQASPVVTEGGLIHWGSSGKGVCDNNSLRDGSLRELCELDEACANNSLRKRKGRLIQGGSLRKGACAKNSLLEASSHCAVQLINMLLNTDHLSQRAIIIQPVSHNDICTCIKEVMSSTAIESQATFNKAPVKWEDCIPPYAVDERAFMNHTCGAKQGLPCDPNPSVHTVGERMATLRAKSRVMNSIKRVGLLAQQHLVLLKVLLDPSIQDISLSIGINMKEKKLGQPLLRCARKLIHRSQNSPNKNGGWYWTSVAQRSIVKALCVSLLPTPTKEPSNDGDLINSKQRDISMRQISKQLGFSVGSSLRTLSLAEKKTS